MVVKTDKLEAPVACLFSRLDFTDVATSFLSCSQPAATCSLILS